jgi:hypothetical protein
MTLVAPAPGRTSTGNQDSGVPSASLDRRALIAVLGLTLIVAGVGLDKPTLLLLGLVTTTTTWLRRWFAADLAVPVATTLLLGSAIVAGLAAAWTGIDLLGRPWLLAGIYVAYGGLITSTTVASQRSAPRGPAPPVPWWSLLPAALAAATALPQAFSVNVAKSWAFYGTDLARHMTLIESLQHQGNLDYSVTPYPRGLHMLATLVSVPGAPLDDPRTLMSYDLQLETSLNWLALALMIWTGTALAIRVGHRLWPTSLLIGTIAGVLLGVSALVTNTLVFGFVYMGGAQALVAVAVLWLAPLAMLCRVPGLDRMPWIAAACCFQAMLLAHLWQPLVLGPACGVAVLAATRMRDLPATIRRRALWSDLRMSGPLAGGALAVAAVPALAVQHAAGVGLAATLGEFPGEPWRMLVPALLCAPMLGRRGLGSWARIYLGVALGLVGVWGLMLLGAEFEFHNWYPVKAVWFLTLVLTPPLALGATATARAFALRISAALGRLERAGFILRTTTLATAVALGFSFWLPHILGAGLLTPAAWHVDGPRTYGGNEHPTNLSGHAFDLAARYGTTFRPSVAVPYYVGFSAVFDVQTTRLVSELLTFQTGQPELKGEPRDICMAITTLAGSRSAVVISKLPSHFVREDMAAHGCAGRAEVLRVPGEIRDVAFARGLPQERAG